MPESPKTRFLKTPHAASVAALSANPAVLAALDAALLQMSWEGGAAQDKVSASARHWQLTGANKFRELFLTIGVKPEPLPKPPRDNLPHQI